MFRVVLFYQVDFYGAGDSRITCPRWTPFHNHQGVNYVAKEKTDNHNKMYINKDGQRVMRITEIIKVLAKDQLMTWANMLGFKHVDYKKELDRTSRIGTMFHAVVERYMDPHELAIIDYDEFEVYGFQSQVEVTNAIKSFFSWFDNLSKPYHIKFTEHVLVGQCYGGTIDCGIDGFEDPEKVIFVDYKTSGSFYLTQFLQLCGYVRLYEELNGENTVEGIMVILADKKEGRTARARLIKREDLEMLLLCFDCLYNTAAMTKTLNGTWWKLGEAVV